MENMHADISVRRIDREQGVFEGCISERKYDKRKSNLSAKYCVATSPMGSFERTTFAPLLTILSSLS